MVEYCKKRYGVDSVANIVTKSYQKPKGAIRNTARVMGVEKGKRDEYLTIADKIAKLIPNAPGVNFASCEESLRESFKIKTGDSEEEKEMKKEANEIIDQAKIVEGVFTNYGMHAAGVIIADGHPIDDYVPLMRDDKSGDMKVQCDMVQAEEFHKLLKFDFLGLKNLKIVTKTIRMVKHHLGIEIDVDKIPFERDVFDKIFATGKTGCVFQFESEGMKDLLRKAKPNCIEDLIALVSLYRPGPMDFIPQYIEWKHNPEKIEYLCPELKPILSKTYGVIVYQEQVMEIVQSLAGYSLSQADNVRRYMSKKKKDKLEHERKSFVYGDSERNIIGCVKNGIKEEVAIKIFEQMLEFASYAFNKSHAAAYAILSYITGYLKFHYPAYYMCAVLMCTEDSKKMPSVLNACKEIGVDVLPPDINKSELEFSVVDGKILFGLNSVKGTKEGYARTIIEDRINNGEYVSFKDFIKRNVSDKSTGENLIKAGAMDTFNPNRLAMLEAYTKGRELVKTLIDKTENLAEKEAVYEENKEQKRFINSYNKLKTDIETLNKQFDILRIINCPEDLKERLLEEKEVLGLFVSGHPMSEYGSPEEMGCTAISDLNSEMNRAKVIGIIQNLKIIGRKADNKPMAFFDLEDQSGSVHVCCFVEKYAENQLKIAENAIVTITGKLHIDTQDVVTTNEDGEEVVESKETIELYAEKVDEQQPNLKGIQITINSMLDWNPIIDKIEKDGYLTKDGHPLLIYDKLNGEFRNTEYHVDESILEDPVYDAIF